MTKSILASSSAGVNLIKIFNLFNNQTNMPCASPTSFQHVGQAPYSMGFKFLENGPIKILSILASRAAMGEFDQNYEPSQLVQCRTRAFLASFQHIGQVSCIEGKFKENRPIKNLVHLGLQGRGGSTCSKFLAFSTHKLIGLPCKFPACSAGPLLKALLFFGKWADQKFGLFWPQFFGLNFQFFGKWADQKFGLFWPPSLRWEN